MPPLFSTVLHHFARFLWPGPPPSMLSPIPQILRDDQYIEVVSNAITEGVWTYSPDTYRRYRLRRVAVTRSNLVRKFVYHQSLVLLFEDTAPLPSNNSRAFHILVAERGTRRDDASATAKNAPSRPTRNVSQTSLEATSKKIPHGEGRDTIRYWAEVSNFDNDFWRGTAGKRDSDFKAENGVVFDFDASLTGPSTTLPTASLTLHEVVLAMRAVTLVAPQYQFTAENCWWWAQSVLLLLLRLRQNSRALAPDECDTFFAALNDRNIVMELPPQYRAITSFVNRNLVLKNAEEALENYRKLKTKANAALELHMERTRLPEQLRKERDAEAERADIERERAEAETERADRSAQENEALRALLVKHGIDPANLVPTTSSAGPTTPSIWA
ncbi:hypothetical protein DL93DRAFT_2085653 [Clavulina sp. PMI_390]|nr:hypothetical protein DL93DRAFT_2085653 [Clavulina sp. PMI_390]